MKRFWIVVAILAVLAGIGFLGYQAYRRIQRDDQRMAELAGRVDVAVQSAQQAAMQAQSASARAYQAAESAQLAAGAREQAEESRKQAEQQRALAQTSQQQAETAAHRAQGELERIRKEREAELNQMQQALNKIVRTERTATGMVMSLNENTFRFEFDKADLKPKNREVLSRIAGILLASKGYGISIFGYTDDVGSAEYNQKLSERRAKAIRDYLIEAGLDQGIINMKGYGKTSPVVRGNTDEARARNRRVEIGLTDTVITYPEAPPEPPR